MFHSGCVHFDEREELLGLRHGHVCFTRFIEAAGFAFSSIIERFGMSIENTLWNFAIITWKFSALMYVYLIRLSVFPFLDH